MKLEPQKALTNKAKAASEESEHRTAQATQQVQSEVEEKRKKNAGAKKSAQKQHDAQPEVAIEPQGLNETQYPAQEPGREDVVPGRRKANEFALSVSNAALAQILLHRRASKHLSNVQTEAYERIYEAERLLCGQIVVIGNVPTIDLSQWWSPFAVDGRWYVLEPREPMKDKVRVYELMPSHGPTPGGGVPPQLERKQRQAPPAYIGPRRRGPGNRNESDGSRASTKPSTPERKRGKKNDVKRVFTELYNSALRELKLLSQKIACAVVQSWRTGKPRLLRSLVEMRRTARSCGTALHDLRNLRDAVASVVQSSRISWVFCVPVRKAETRQQRQLASETHGPTGRLVVSNAGLVVSARLRLYSWSWDIPPLPRADDTCGALWPPNWFGPREEEVFT